MSRLVDGLYRLGAGAALVWLLALVWLRRLRLPPPPLGRYLAYLALAAAALALGVIAVGAKQVFYTAHTLIFPAGHQWFFYYEESLMTMLMKAPDLFAAIAAEWLLLTALCYSLGIWLSRRLICRAGCSVGAALAANKASCRASPVVIRSDRRDDAHQCHSARVKANGNHRGRGAYRDTFTRVRKDLPAMGHRPIVGEVSV